MNEPSSEKSAPRPCRHCHRLPLGIHDIDGPGLGAVIKRAKASALRYAAWGNPFLERSRWAFEIERRLAPNERPIVSPKIAGRGPPVAMTSCAVRVSASETITISGNALGAGAARGQHIDRY